MDAFLFWMGWFKLENTILNLGMATNITKTLSLLLVHSQACE